MVKICSFNVKGVGDLKKRRQIFKWIRDNGIAIALLQETHSTKNTEHIWKSEWGFEAFFSGNISNSCGVAILINNNFQSKIIFEKEIVEGRVVSVKLEIDGIEFIIINIYGPNHDDSSIYYKIREFMLENETENFIIGGDFNVVQDPKLDKENGLPNRNLRCRRMIQSIIQQFDLEDIWRAEHPDFRQFTWESNNTPPIRCRLDYFLTSSRIRNIINNSYITSGIKSDHYPVLFSIAINPNKRGPGYFKLNNSLLLDTEYQNMIKQSIQTITSVNEGCNPNTMWELIKGTVRNETIKYASTKKRENVKKEKELQKDIDKLMDQNNPNDTNIQEQIKQKKSHLEKIYDEKVNGLIIRSKARWIEGGEKNTKYFANLEKRNFESRVIHRLNINGNTITDQETILEEQKKNLREIIR